jgi:RNA polymerase sigma factor (sigma-70 family)
LWHFLKARPVPQSDDDLLREFVKARSEPAFTALVERHGGMVLGVCRRILGHAQDAEDAYQAAFLVLARKAPGLVGTGPLGPWLYGVARRVALKALTRRPRELADLDPALTAGLLADEEISMDLAEVRPILDAEVARLPRKYRHALILCQLEGQSKAEAARQLGCPEGTISSRLMRAKDMLRARLVKRGIALSSLGVLDTMLAPPVASAALVQTTVQTALTLGFGTALVAGVVSPSVLSLTQGVTQAMLLTKLKLLTAGLVVAAGMSLGAGYVLGGGQEKGNGPGKTDDARPPVTKQDTPLKNDDGDVSTPKDADAIRRELSRYTNRFNNRFGEQFPLSDQIDFFQKVYGFAIVVEAEAFRDILPDVRIEDILNTPTSIARMPGETTGGILKSFLGDLTIGNNHIPSTYMIRRNHVVIVPKSYAKLAAEKIDAVLEAKSGMTLVQALEQLSSDSGVSIVIDPRVTEQATATTIKTSLRNVRLISAARMLANMADLTVMNVDGALYVTDATNAARLQTELEGGPLMDPLMPGGAPKGVTGKAEVPTVGGTGVPGKLPAGSLPPSGKR